VVPLPFPSLDSVGVACGPPVAALSLHLMIEFFTLFKDPLASLCLAFFSSLFSYYYRSGFWSFLSPPPSFILSPYMCFFCLIVLPDVGHTTTLPLSLSLSVFLLLDPDDGLLHSFSLSSFLLDSPLCGSHVSIS
jgi:hypothetical protein